MAHHPYGILVIGHGTREPAGQRAFLELVDGLRDEFPDHPMEPAFLEAAEPTIGEALGRLGDRCRNVVAAPVLLNRAGHAKMDIPRALAAAAPGSGRAIRLRQAATLGTGEDSRRLLHRRFAEAHGAERADPATGLVVLSRGTRHSDALGAMVELAWSLGRTAGAGRADAAFCDAAPPDLQAVVADQIDTGMDRIRILPALLFEGRLLGRVRDEVAALRAGFPGIDLRLGSPLGSGPELRDGIADRIRAAAAELDPAGAHR